MHGDYHQMGKGCWSHTIAYFLASQEAGLDNQSARDAYQREVEAKMLASVVSLLSD